MTDDDYAERLRNHLDSLAPGQPIADEYLQGPGPTAPLRDEWAAEWAALQIERYRDPAAFTEEKRARERELMTLLGGPEL